MRPAPEAQSVSPEDGDRKTKTHTGTNDHVVPKMYLRRFAVDRAGGPQVQAANVASLHRAFTVSTNNVGAEKSFYWSSGPGGVPVHDMEAFLTSIESEAASAFRRILDKGRLPADNALPDRWPPTPETRQAVSWWIAAQLIRTAPQRERLWRIHGNGPLEPPRSLRRSDLHHAYIVQAVAPLAALIHARPWGIGFTNLCLLTSDAPVQVLNARPDDDPLATATFWDLYLPLDPHRFMYLPGQMHARQRELMRDHSVNLPGGLAIALNHEVIETAHRHVIWHPSHDPRPRIDVQRALRSRNSRQTRGEPGTVMRYSALPVPFGIERRWLESHTWDSDVAADATAGESEPRSEAAVIALAEEMMGKLGSAKDEFDRRYPT